MTVVGDYVVFDRQQNVFTVHSQLESAGFEVGHHYEWCWYSDRYAARFRDVKDIASFLLQRG